MEASTGEYNLSKKYRNRMMCKKDANPNEKSSNNKSEEKIKFCRVFEAAREQETSNRLSQVVFVQITYHQPSS